MRRTQIEYGVISNAINQMCLLCAGNKEKVVEMLTGYLWDEEEADGILKSKGEYDFTECFKEREQP